MTTVCKFLIVFLVYLKLLTIWAYACIGGIDLTTNPNPPYLNLTLSTIQPHQYMALIITQSTPSPLLNLQVIRADSKINFKNFSPEAISPITTKSSKSFSPLIIKENSSSSINSIKNVGVKMVSAKNEALDRIRSVGVKENFDNFSNIASNTAEEAAKSVADSLKVSEKSILTKLKALTFPEKLDTLANFAKEIFSENINEKVQWDQVSFFLILNIIGTK